MAKQNGPLLFSGSIGDITYYKRRGEWLARKKTSLNKERLDTDPAFENSRRQSLLFGKAAALAAVIYRQWPTEKKRQTSFGRLTALVKQLMQDGSGEEAIIQQLV